MTNKGKFQKGNQAAAKAKCCPYCKRELQIRVYTYLIGKSLSTNGNRNNTDLKRQGSATEC